MSSVSVWWLVLLGVVMATDPVAISSGNWSGSCYTQGLFFLEEGLLFESCGLYGESYFRTITYEESNGTLALKEKQRSDVPFRSGVFIEGSTRLGDSIYILTWREQIVYKLNYPELTLNDTLKWPYEGWGLTNNGTHLFVSDGSEKLYVTDDKMEILSRKTITDLNQKHLFKINELEFYDGYIYANIYMENRIVKIDYSSGKVISQFNLKTIADAETKLGAQYGECLNGIAIRANDTDSTNPTFVITGKNWKQLYRLDIS